MRTIHMTVEQGSTVTVSYTGKLADGTVFDSSDNHDEPMTFTVGENQVIPGFEEAVIGMAEGDEKEVALKPENAYGQVRDDLVQKVPVDQLPDEAEEGSQLVVQAGPGQQMPATVTEIGDEQATLDLNHPLAGKTLHFTLKVESIE